jgi:hypothetical protein
VIFTGDLRGDFTRQLLAGVELAASQKKMDRFYICVTTIVEGQNLKTKLIIMSVSDGRKLAFKPLIGTMLFRVDKPKGEIELVYCLPPDSPISPFVEFEGNSELVANGAQGKSIVYDGN